MLPVMEIFGNPIAPRVVRQAHRRRKGYARRFGFDPEGRFELRARPEPTLAGLLDLETLVLDPDAASLPSQKAVIIGTIRMGYGHYRIGLAIASAARAMGLRPLWLDLLSIEGSPGASIIGHLEGLYNLGSRLSRSVPLFDRFYWEPLTSRGFRSLDYNARDREMCRLLAPVFRDLPASLPVIGTHSWPSQAALHAGCRRVVNVIPDNWPLALHLAEGSLHTVQSPSAYLGYRLLKDMGRPGQSLRPMPSSALSLTGHYVDHELVAGLESDSARRIHRLDQGSPRRLLVSIGGAGVQAEWFRETIRRRAGILRDGEAVLFLNVGHHRIVLDQIASELNRQGLEFVLHQDWAETREFATAAREGEVRGIHLFQHDDIFPAVYTTNLLMRASDVLLTKPSELAFYPIPKLFVRRVGGHEAWGAIRAAELGESSLECTTTEQLLEALDLILKSPEVLRMQNEAILRSRAAGLYDGATRVIEHAMI
jgi:hypothetical protein